MDISTGYFSRVTAQLLLDRAGNSIVDWVFERDLPAQPCLTVTTHEATNTHLFAGSGDVITADHIAWLVG